MRQFTTVVVAASVVLRVVLLLYGDWQDRHFNVKYTDVDYDVYSDAARYVVEGKSPYERATYRYAPLVAWLLVPNVIWTRLWGKGVFCLFDVMVGWLIGKWDNGGAMPVALWLFNPFTFAISTRGSCDSVTVFLVMTVMILLRRRAYVMAGVMWGVAVHWRVFPVIYGPAILFYLVPRAPNKHTLRSVFKWMQRAICIETVSFGCGALGSLCLLGAAFYGLYGDDYVNEAILYHLARQDPRHNFALHFYSIYLTDWGDVEVTLLDRLGKGVRWLDLGRVSAGMQLVLIVMTAIKCCRDLALSFTLTTLIFVAFNKVSTAQYFVWYFGLVPLLISRLPAKNWTSIGISFLLWVLAQGHWLLWAYLLEFQGWSCHLYVWMASCLFLLAHVQLFGAILTSGS